ncbi:MAG TPA: STAS domain-containing protein [Mycobacterium sp.]|nr:STAS domain-containing protein [Mycobacterium sp.]
MTVTDNVLVEKQFNESIERGGAAVSAETVGQTTIICIRGEVDASNADFVMTVLEGFATRRSRVVVDASGLSFVGTQGLRLLVNFDQRCQRHDVVWALVSCRLLRRLLQVVDAEQLLPVAASVDDAQRMLESVEASPAERTLQRVAPEKLRC